MNKNIILISSRAVLDWYCIFLRCVLYLSLSEATYCPFIGHMRTVFLQISLRIRGVWAENYTRSDCADADRISVTRHWSESYSACWYVNESQSFRIADSIALISDQIIFVFFLDGLASADCAIAVWSVRSTVNETLYYWIAERLALKCDASCKNGSSDICG